MIRNPPGRLRRFLAVKERQRAQLQLDAMEAVNRGMAGGSSYIETAERLFAIVYPQNE